MKREDGGGYFLPQPAYDSTFAKATADKKATAVRKNAENTEKEFDLCDLCVHCGKYFYAVNR
jgi:hypothetical protein